MNIKPPFVIFSASLKEYGDEINLNRTDFVKRQLQQRNISYRVIQGHNPDFTEHAFLVFTHEGTYESQVVESIADRYGQTCVLYVDASGLSYLKYMDRRPIEELGQFKEISPYDASRIPKFNYIEGKYYATGERI